MKYFVFLSIFVAPLFSASLDEVVSYALKNSTTINLSQADSQLAKLKIKESKASRFGELNLVGSATHYNIERTLAPMTPSSMKSTTPITTSNDIYSGGLTYNLPLFTGFAQTRDIEINELAHNMSEIKTKLTKEQLVYNIKTLYLSILSLIEIKNAQHNYTKALKRLNSQIAYEVKLGKKAMIDELKSNSDIALSNAKEQMLKANIKTTKAILSSLSGMRVKQVENINIDVKRVSYDIDSLLQDSNSLAKIKVEDLSLKKADKLIEKSSSANLPQLNLSSYYGKNFGEDEIRDELDDAENWQVGINLKYNILDFGKRDANIQKAKIAKLKAKLKKEQTLLNLQKDLIEAIGKIDQNYAEYLGNKKAYRLSKKAQSIERVRYKNSVSTLNDYLLSKSKTQLALAKLIESKYNYQKSIYYMDYILERGSKDEK
jgi:outer membrane protein TolC